MNEWRVIVPVKRAAAGKSRFAADVPADVREELARAFALDTVAAVAEAQRVGAVHVVSDEFESHDPRVHVLSGAPHGLNPALAFGLAEVRRSFPEAPIVIVLGDLPALRPDDVDAVLEVASRHPLAFVRDADATGTTMLLVQPGVAYTPVFGGASAAAHEAAGAVDLSGEVPERARRDVDGIDALREADLLGLSEHTHRSATASGLVSRERITP